jgi:hypothetical protein
MVEMGHRLPGIIWLRPGITLGHIIDELFLIWTASTAEEYQDALLFLPHGFVTKPPAPSDNADRSYGRRHPYGIRLLATFVKVGFDATV